MLLTLEETKLYLRVDGDTEDALIENLVESAEQMCLDAARLTEEEVPGNEKALRVAILYAIAFLYENREKADHHELQLMLRSLLFGVRKAAF